MTVVKLPLPPAAAAPAVAAGPAAPPPEALLSGRDSAESPLAEARWVGVPLLSPLLCGARRWLVGVRGRCVGGPTFVTCSGSAAGPAEGARTRPVCEARTAARLAGVTGRGPPIGAAASAEAPVATGPAGGLALAGGDSAPAFRPKRPIRFALPGREDPLPRSLPCSSRQCGMSAAPEEKPAALLGRRCGCPPLPEC